MATEMPTVAEVTQALRDVYAEMRRYSFSDADVRLQVYPDGDWIVRWGDAQYDTDHRGYWGASCLSPEEGTDPPLRDIAFDLVSQCAEAAALDQED